MTTRRTGSVGKSFLPMSDISKKRQGMSEVVKDHRGDRVDTLPYPRMSDRGEGSAMVYGTLREQALAARRERDVPGALGSKVDLNVKSYIKDRNDAPKE